jgi:hypothetical protein
MTWEVCTLLPVCTPLQVRKRGKVGFKAVQPHHFSNPLYPALMEEDRLARLQHTSSAAATAAAAAQPGNSKLRLDRLIPSLYTC